MIDWLLKRSGFLSKEFKKISESLKKKNDRIFKLEEDIKELKKEFISKREIELMIKEIVSLSIQFEPNSEPNHSQYEKAIIKRAIKTRPEIIKQAIRGLLDKDMKTTEIFKLIVEEKRLISKTQFYHYLSLVRNELRTKLRTEPQIE